MSKVKQPIPDQFASEEFQAAAANFLDGLWDSPHRLSMFRATMVAIWNDYKRTGRYEQLRQALSDAAKGRKSP
jgi:hypothetical protein